MLTQYYILINVYQNHLQGPLNNQFHYDYSNPNKKKLIINFN